MRCHLQKFRSIAYEQPGQRPSQCLSRCKHQHRKDADQQKALFLKSFQFFIVPCTIMIADHRCRTYRISEKYGLEYHTDIHQDSICGDPVLPCIFHQLYIIEHTHQRHGNIAYQFGRAIGTYPE